MIHNYGRALRILRAINGISQTELAKRGGVGEPMISLVEANKRKPSLHTLETWTALLGVDMHTFFYLASPDMQTEDILRRLAPPHPESDR